MDRNGKRIGIIGGTFNPIHFGHLLIAEQSYQEYDLDEVRFLPAGHPPHKQSQQIASNEDRLAMLRLAVENVPYFQISDYELQKQGLSYTYETLSYFSAQESDAVFYFIMGADSVKDLDCWKHPEIILKKAKILAAVRGDTDIEGLKEEADRLSQKYQASILLLHTPQLDISSRDLRRRVAEGRSIRFMVPESVRNYIEDHDLYQHLEKEGGEEYSHGSYHH